MRLYKRSIRVIIGDDESAVQIDSLKIEIEIKKTNSSKPVEGFVRIYNLNESTETMIREKGKRIRILVGYDNVLNTVTDSGIGVTGQETEYEQSLTVAHDGQIRQVERAPENGRDRVTHITLGGNVFVSSETLSEVSYSGQVSVRQIVQDVAPDFGLDVGDLSKIPEAYVNDFAFSGRTSDLLDRILNPIGVNWLESNRIIQFSTIGEPVLEDIVVLRAGTGLIASPAVTDRGVKVKAQMSPRIEIGCRVQLISESINNGVSGSDQSSRAGEQQGLYKVIQYIHRGDNRDGEFLTEFEAVPSL